MAAQGIRLSHSVMGIALACAASAIHRGSTPAKRSANHRGRSPVAGP